MNAQDIIINSIKETAVEIARHIKSLENALIGCNTVIRTADGLYLEGKIVDGMAQFRPVCITKATRWERGAAERIAADLPKSEHWNPTPVSLHKALETELSATEKLAASFQVGA